MTDSGEKTMIRWQGNPLKVHTSLTDPLQPSISIRTCYDSRCPKPPMSNEVIVIVIVTHPRLASVELSHLVARGPSRCARTTHRLLEILLGRSLRLACTMPCMATTPSWTLIQTPWTSGTTVEESESTSVCQRHPAGDALPLSCALSLVTCDKHTTSRRP